MGKTTSSYVLPSVLPSSLLVTVYITIPPLSSSSICIDEPFSTVALFEVSVHSDPSIYFLYLYIMVATEMQAYRGSWRLHMSSLDNAFIPTHIAFHVPKAHSDFGCCTYVILCLCSPVKHNVCVVKAFMPVCSIQRDFIR